jgi:hypothetical protein
VLWSSLICFDLTNSELQTVVQHHIPIGRTMSEELVVFKETSFMDPDTYGYKEDIYMQRKICSIKYMVDDQRYNNKGG